MKKKTMLIRSARLADGTELDLLIEDGMIAKMGAIDAAADIEFDAAGKTVLPAFVDMHAHLREPGFEQKEDIGTGCASAVKGGYGAICCMPNTRPAIDNVPLVRYVRERAAEVGLCKVYPIGCITKGAESKELADMRLMREAGAIAFSDDGKPVADSHLMYNALMTAAGTDLLLISHSEDKSLTDDGYANEGVNASKAGIRGITRASEEVSIAREIILAATLGARIHIAHVSTRGSVEIIRQAKAHGVRVTCETCPHYFAATDSEILGYNTNAKINPPLRTDDDVAAIIEGLKDGTIDAIATDHAPHHVDDKRVEFARAAFGTVGFESAFSLGVTYLVKPGHITLAELSALMSARPAAILGLEDFGRIEIGAPANFVLVKPDAEYTFRAADLVSKSKNTLFDGWTLSGKVGLTVVDGDVKYACDCFRK